MLYAWRRAIRATKENFARISITFASCYTLVQVTHYSCRD